ncbi:MULTISPECIES: terminase large subunit [unclassified Granulicatella]|uniref:terminase large subunit n=1 Tax=unclassified Granulicatella TaxID=2630493 RepID=UPI0010733F1F|nr:MULTISPECIES: terminase TerL endonuclease subunit [unclassified Granulicatella]MBF0780504.1 terminase large subunit [Granulicatella sp. 19428wC4_WM01]TFU95320.1 terminase large subunit [Granulicatella sp. WM01]
MTTLREMLIDYSNQVISNEKHHCQKERWANQRFLRDLQRENTDDFPYIFNEDKALRFLNWMSKFKHSKGKLAGQYINPAPIQIFIFSNLYGWIHKDTGYRRFKKSYWQVARKNAKTQSMACVGSYEASAFGEAYSEVYIGATKSDQAKLLWNETNIQISKSEFSDKFKVSYGKITHIKSGGFIQALSKDSGKTGDGFNPQAGLIDEYHAHKTTELYDVIDSGMGARTQPLLNIITTAGFELTNPCYAIEYQYVSKILNPHDDIENEEYFVMVNELEAGDDIKDEETWIKANPIVATHDIGMNYLRGQLKIALDVPEKMRNFLTKNMNIWVDMPENGYMDITKWDKNSVDNETLEKAIKTADNCYLGVDLSMTTDLTSISLVAEKDGKKYVKQLSFMPEEKYYERMNTDKVPYDLYVKDSLLILTEGAVVDYSVVESYILKWCEEYPVKMVCFDKYNAVGMMVSLSAKGINAIEIPQTIIHLSLPTKEFRNEVYKGNVYHNGDKLLKRAILNAKTRVDDQENIMISKRTSNGRIDPLASVLNAFSRILSDAQEVDANLYYSSADFSF